MSRVLNLDLVQSLVVVGEMLKNSYPPATRATGGHLPGVVDESENGSARTIKGALDKFGWNAPPTEGPRRALTKDELMEAHKALHEALIASWDELAEAQPTAEDREDAERIIAALGWDQPGPN